MRSWRLKTTDEQRPPLTLAHYDQSAAEVDGALDVGLLTRWLRETHSNTINFLIYDTDGHQYLDMVRFLSQTANATVDGQPLRVWVTLVPLSDDYDPDTMDCAMCPKDKPFTHGNLETGTYCCAEGCPEHPPSARCCLIPGNATGDCSLAGGAMGLCMDGGHPLNRKNYTTLCHPTHPPDYTRCSVPADSPLTPFNESALFNSGLGYKGCNDFIAWSRVLNRVARQFPRLVAVDIDDFVSVSTATAAVFDDYLC